jgi:hypothetical protein
MSDDLGRSAKRASQKAKRRHGRSMVTARTHILPQASLEDTDGGAS